MIDERVEGPVPDGNAIYITPEELIDAVELWINKNMLLRRKVFDIVPDGNRFIVKYKLD